MQLHDIIEYLKDKTFWNAMSNEEDYCQHSLIRFKRYAVEEYLERHGTDLDREYVSVNFQYVNTLKDKNLDTKKIETILTKMVESEPNVTIEISYTQQESNEIMWFQYTYTPKGI